MEFEYATFTPFLTAILDIVLLLLFVKLHKKM